MRRSIFFLLFFLVINKISTAQPITDIDASFATARKLAFSGKYNQALQLCKQLLKISPGYSDVQVLQGRVYFWNHQTDSALYVLNDLLSKKPYEDGYIAMADIQRWTYNNSDALFFVNEGLRNFPASKELLIKKAQIIDGIGNHKQAYQLLDSLLKNNRMNAEARAFAEKIKRNSYKNKMGTYYDYDHFDKRFSDDWHLFSIAYAHQTPWLGPVIGRVNYANRFGNSNGLQYELDMYPAFGPKTYAYVSGGYSSPTLSFDKFQFSPFPKYRYGVSVYRTLPRAFEAELGIRYLFFSSPVFIYTGSIGKYYGNFWFSLRPSIVFNANGGVFSQSYGLVTRYYTRSADDYFTLTMGYGVFPDDRTLEILQQNPSLRSFKLRIAYQWLIRSKYIFQLSSGWLKEEFVRDGTQTGNDYSLGIGIERLF